jgi:hypothetical protein
MWRTIAASLVLCAALATAGATPIIDVGTHDLRPNEAGQVVRIFVTGGEEVQGLEFNAQIGTGSSGPMFEYCDILGETVFAESNTGLNDGSYIDPRRLYLGTSALSGTPVYADGLLAMLLVDTTGLESGRWPLLMENSFEGPTNFAGAEADIENGWLVIEEVPEPTAALLLTLVAAMRRRRHRTS